MSGDGDRGPPIPGGGNDSGGTDSQDGTGPNRTNVRDAEGASGLRGVPADRRLTIARRELAALKSEKTILLAVMIQLFIAAFSSLLVVGLVSMYDPSSVQGYTTEIAVTGNASDPVLDAIGEVDGVDGRAFASSAAAQEAFDEGRADALLFAQSSSDGTVQIEAVAPEGSLRSTLVVVQLREVLERLETDLRQAQADRIERTVVPVPEKSSTNPYFGFTYTVLLPLLMFLPAFMSGSIAVDSISEEVTRGTLELLRVSPATLMDIVDGKLAAATVLGPVQAGLWLILLSLNGTRVTHGLAILVAVTAFTLLVVAFGIVASLAYPDRTKAQLIYSFGILIAVGVGSFLPEHPANTIARLAIGSTGPVTWASLFGYVVVAVGGYLLVRRTTGRLDTDGL